MKALSIHSYYASAIACGLKFIELRSWETSYTGNVLICSTVQDCKNKDLKDFLIFGKAIAVVNLVGCTPFESSHRQAAFVDDDEVITNPEKLYSWVLDDIRPIKPFDVKGQLRLFNVDVQETDLEYLPFDVSTDVGAIALQEYWKSHGYIKEYPWD